MKIYAKIRDEEGNSCCYLLVRNKSKIYWEALYHAVQLPVNYTLPFHVWGFPKVNSYYNILVSTIIDHTEIIPGNPLSVENVYIKQEIPFKESHLYDA